MTLTNRKNLPNILLDVIKNDSYDGVGFTATTIINNPHLYYLRLKHKDDVVEDVLDHFHTLLGKAVHYVFEKAGSSYLTEVRFKTTIEDKRLIKPVEISAQIDVFDVTNKILTDLKIVTKAKTGVSEEYEAQLNIQKYIMERNGFTVNQMELLHIYRDWYKKDKYDSMLPQDPIARKPVPMWTRTQVEEYIVTRLLLFQNYDGTPCTEKERWTKPTVYAVKTPTANRSRKNFTNFDEAQMALKPGEIVETRPGGDPRCQEYCSLNNFCSFYINKYLAKMPQEKKESEETW